MIVPLYWVVIMPQLEYYVHFLALNIKEDLEKLQRIQRQVLMTTKELNKSCKRS